jgi:hypothetical protein
MPLPMVALPCGSRSTSSTRLGVLREGSGQVDRGGGLADSAFLVGDSDDAGHAARCLE